MIKGLHHSAYRCRDSEETRKFYEDFLELPLAATIELPETIAGRKARALHTFFRMADGSFIAFFEEPGAAFDFKRQDEFDLHIALAVDRPALERFRAKGKAAGIEARGILETPFAESVYFFDPNGYMVELIAPKPGIEAALPEVQKAARPQLDAWQEAKRAHMPH